MDVDLDADPDADQNPDPGFDDQKLEKITANENYIVDLKNCNLLIPMPLKRIYKLQAKLSDEETKLLDEYEYEF